jgi:phospholipase C
MGSVQFRKRLLNSVFAGAATLSILTYNASYALASQPSFGENQNDRRTRSPIKHVVVIIGENRTFDHIFATYRAPNGDYVDNLLSKGIINIDGSKGPHYELSEQHRATNTTAYSIAPQKIGEFDKNHPEQSPGISYAPKVPYTDWQVAAFAGPGALDKNVYSLSQVDTILDHSLAQNYLPLIYTGSTGTTSYIDTRIKDYASLPNGVYPLVDQNGASLYDSYGGSPVHRFFQMWQQLDCDADHVSRLHPSGCRADLFSWVETTVSSGGNGGAPHTLKEGDIALGFYNVAKGDAPYLTKLAQDYTLSDNYHQGVMGGTWANFMMLGYADALYYAGPNGDPAMPPANVIENPNPWPDQTLTGADNWYANDGYGGGSYVHCADKNANGVAPIASYLKEMHVKPNCEDKAFYLVNNFAPAYTGKGVWNTAVLSNWVSGNPANGTTGVNLLPFVLPPVVKQRHIGDALTQKQVSYAYFGERWNQFKDAPPGAWNEENVNSPDLNAATAYLYCNICNPFLYSASTMTDPVLRTQHNKDLSDFYDAIESGTLPAVSYVKPSIFEDGHPSSSKLDLFEGFVKKIVDKIKSHDELWEDTAILVTVDEGGGYYDSGYTQPLDFFGDGTRIPLIAVSKYSKGGHVSHEYTDHASIIKFIERNWELGKLSPRTRDNLPNPITTSWNPYVPTNGPAIGDLWRMFDFDDHGSDRD